MKLFEDAEKNMNKLTVESGSTKEYAVSWYNFSKRILKQVAQDFKYFTTCLYLLMDDLQK